MATMKTLNGYGFNATELNGKTSDSYLQLGDDGTGSTGEAPALNAGTFGGMTVSQFVEMIYPVGSIYMSANATSPETLFGGTWTPINGRFLIGTGTPENNDDGTSPGSYNFAAGSTDGEATHTLTVSEMPRHGHSALKESSGWGENMTLEPWTVYFKNDAFTDAGSSGYTAEFWSYNPLKGTGDGLAHNNMPPYLAVYMWQRTA